MIVIEFFRDILDGIVYYLYLAACILAFFYVLGIVADEKREMIAKKLKEKKTYDIESGREAAIAAMESKQILAVEEQPTATNPDNPNEKKEEVPTVMVLNSSDNGSTNTTTQQAAQPQQNVASSAVQPAVTPPVKQEEPLVLNSN